MQARELFPNQKIMRAEYHVEAKLIEAILSSYLTTDIRSKTIWYIPIYTREEQKKSILNLRNFVYDCRLLATRFKYVKLNVKFARNIVHFPINIIMLTTHNFSILS